MALVDEAYGFIAKCRESCQCSEKAGGDGKSPGFRQCVGCKADVHYEADEEAAEDIDDECAEWEGGAEQGKCDDAEPKSAECTECACYSYCDDLYHALCSRIVSNGGILPEVFGMHNQYCIKSWVH